MQVPISLDIIDINCPIKAALALIYPAIGQKISVSQQAGCNPGKINSAQPASSCHFVSLDGPLPHLKNNN